MVSGEQRLTIFKTLFIHCSILTKLTVLFNKFFSARRFPIPFVAEGLEIVAMMSPSAVAALLPFCFELLSLFGGHVLYAFFPTLAHPGAFPAPASRAAFAKSKKDLTEDEYAKGLPEGDYAKVEDGRDQGVP